MAQIPAMLFASTGAGVSSHLAANASSSDFDAILAALTPDTQLAHLPAAAVLSEYASLHDYSALPGPAFGNSMTPFSNIGVRLPPPTITMLKASVALPVATLPVTMGDRRKQDQDTPKPAAPSRTAAPPSATLNVPPQPITPIRPVAAPAPASPVFGIGALDDGADYTVPPAATSSLSSNSAPPASKAGATDEPDQAQESTASPANLPRATQGETSRATFSGTTQHQDAEIVSISRITAETPHSTTNNPVAQQSPVRVAPASLSRATQGEPPRSPSSDATQRRDAEIAPVSRASTETPRSATGSSVAQLSPVRITPGTTLPQHVVDAIMAAAEGSNDLPPATIPMSLAGKVAQPDPRPRTSDVKGAASGLPPAGAGSDRTVKTSASANATSRVSTVATSEPESAGSGSRQPVDQGSNRATPASPAKADDVPLRALAPLVRASGANVTTYEAQRLTQAEIEPDQAVKQSPPAVANTDVSDARREMQPAQPRIAVTDQTAKPSSFPAVDSSVADTNPRPQQNPASVEPADQVADQRSIGLASSEVGDAHPPARNSSATAPADTAAKQASTAVGDQTVDDAIPETHQSTVLTMPRDGAAKQQTVATDRGLAPAQTPQKPATPAAADQIAKPQPVVVTDPEIADPDTQPSNADLPVPSPTAFVDNPELADTNSQGKQEPASADPSAPSAPAKSADANKPQAGTQAQPDTAAIEAIDPAEMLVSETVQTTAAGDVPAQARGPGNRAADVSVVAPKTDGSSGTGVTSEQLPPIALATASTTKTTGDADASADDAAADDAAAQNQTGSAAGKAEAVPAAQSGSAVPAAPTANQPGGVTPMPGAAQVAATVNTVATTTAAPASAVASAIAEPAPDIDNLAVAIAANAARGAKYFDIRLDPPELGRVDVHMSVSRDGKAEALLTADRPETLELLQRDSKTLERALKDAGLDLSNNSLNFSLKGQQRQGDGGGASTARTRSLPDAVVARAEAANASTPIWSYAPGSARLDIRV